MKKRFSSNSLQEAEEYVTNTLRLLAEARWSEVSLWILENRREDLKDAEREREYFQTTVPFEGTPSLEKSELWLSDGQDVIILEPGDPIEIFFAGIWQRGFLGKGLSDSQNFYFYNSTVDYIGLTADGLALNRQVRGRVVNESVQGVSDVLPVNAQPRAHVIAQVLSFIKNALDQVVQPQRDSSLLIGHLSNGRGVAVVWGESREDNRILTWKIRKEIMESAKQRGLATPILVFAGANTAPLNEELVRFYQLPDCLTNSGAIESLQRHEKGERV